MNRFLLLCVVHAKQHALSLAVPASLEKSEEHPSRRQRHTLSDLIPISALPRKALCLPCAWRQRCNLRLKNT